MISRRTVELIIILSLVVTVDVGADQICRDNIPTTAADVRFTDNGDGSVKDDATGLVWRRCVEGMSGPACAVGTPLSLSWQEALNHAEAAEHAGNIQWRLPNKNELETLVERRCRAPAINSRYFPNYPAGTWTVGDVWSSSTYAGRGASAWFVEFYSGSVGYRSKSSDHYVQLVHDSATYEPLPLVDSRIYLSTTAGSIYAWDLTTDRLELIGNPGLMLTDIAFAPDGRLFGITADTLYAVDADTGAVAMIGPLASATELYFGVSSLTEANGFDISPNGIGRVSSGNNYLIAEVDLATGEVANNTGSLLGPAGQSAGDIWYVSESEYLLTTTSYTLVNVAPNLVNGEPTGREIVASSQFISSARVDGLVSAPAGATVVAPGTPIGFVGNVAYALGPGQFALGPGLAILGVDGDITGAARR